MNCQKHSTHLPLLRSLRIALLLCLLLPGSLFAQREINIWYFGAKAGVDFNSGSPVPLTDSEMETPEGCTAVSDINGNLLFYSDGITVWNKTHQIMQNGSGLLGDPSASQSGLAFRLPQSQDRYFLFSVDNDGGNNGLRYSLIDMSANNGLGAVLQKNVLLISPVTEKITAVRHANGQDVWVIAHGWNNNAFHAMRVDVNGINPPVSTNIGRVHGPLPPESRGCMKVSPDGTLLCAAVHGDGIAEMFNFNDATGQVTSARSFPVINWLFGVEFSPDNGKLYLSGQDGIYQFDLTLGSHPAISASQTLIGSSALTQNHGGLQIGPDQRIYCSVMGSKYLAGITNPNAAGAACNFVDSLVYLDGRESRLGLPNFVQSFFLPPEPSFNFTVPCLGDSTRFFGSATEPPDLWIWDFGDPASGSANFSGLQRPKHLYTAAGTYTVSLIVEKFGLRDTVTHTVTVLDYPAIDLGNDTIICNAPSLELDPGASGSLMLWSDGSSDPTLTVNQTGIYWLEAGNGPCRIRDSIEVKFIPLNYVYIGDDDTFCEGDSVTLNAGNTGAGYQWSTGASSQTITVKSTGTYMVTVTAGICQLSDTAQITVVPQPSVNLGPDRTECADQVQLWGGQALEYIWSTGESDRYIYVTQSGEYSIEVRNQFCTRTDTVDITLLRPAKVDLGPDRAICPAEGVPLTLTAIQDNVSYAWSTGENSQSISVSSPGLYSVELMTPEGCSDRDEILIYEECVSRLFVPTAFSPNGDGLNDEFFVVGSSLSDFRMEIYDRWGALIFSAQDPGTPWDGRVNGKPAQEGVYIVKIWYQGQSEGGKNIEDTLSGSLTLIR